MKLEDVEVDTFAKLDLKSGDFLILHINDVLNQEAQQKIRKKLYDFFKPLEIKVLIIQGEVTEFKVMLAEVEDIQPDPRPSPSKPGYEL